MSPYSWYFSAIILPIAFLLVVWPVVFVKLIWYPSHITKEMLSVPQHKFLVLGALDTLYNVLSTWPIKATGSTVANVLAQSVLPLNMVLSFVVLRTRYTGQHLAGALLVIYAVLIRLLPALRDSSSDGDGDNDVSAGEFLAWSVVLVGSQIFAALSNVYKEVALKGSEDLDVWYTNACISSWQLVFGLVTVPLVGLKFTPDYVPLKNLGTYMRDANKCFFGHNAVEGDVCDSDTVSPLVIFVFFIGFNIGYNLLMLETMKRGSSVLFVVASAVRLPVVDVMLMWPLLAGLAGAMFTAFDGFALVALLLAMYLYNAEKEKKSSLPPLGLSDLWAGFVRHALCCECGCLEEFMDGSESGKDGYGETAGLLGRDGDGDAAARQGHHVRVMAAVPGGTGMMGARASYLDDAAPDSGLIDPGRGEQRDAAAVTVLDAEEEEEAADAGTFVGDEPEAGVGVPVHRGHAAHGADAFGGASAAASPGSGSSGSGYGTAGRVA